MESGPAGGEEDGFLFVQGACPQNVLSIGAATANPS